MYQWTCMLYNGQHNFKEGGKGGGGGSRFTAGEKSSFPIHVSQKCSLFQLHNSLFTDL